MKFKALPVTSLEDATVDLEQLQALLGSPGSQLPFLQLLSAKQLALDLGTGNAVFSAALDAAPVAVAHGLGRTPLFAAAFNSSAIGVWFSVGTFTTSHVTYQASYRSSTTGTVPFVWLAIG